MLRTNTKSYDEIREYLDEVPVIDIHEHNPGMMELVPADNVLDLLTYNYMKSDFESASFEKGKKTVSFVQPEKTLSFTEWAERKGAVSIEEQFELFREIYGRAKHTAFSKGVQIGMKECWGIEKLDDLDALKELEKKLDSRNQDFYDRMMEKYHIKEQIFIPGAMRGTLGAFPAEMKFFLGDEEKKNYSKYCRFALDLTYFCGFTNKTAIFILDEHIDRTITCLDDYLESFENYLKEWMGRGLVCLKDWNAYRRQLSYSNPSKGEAEKVFNDIMSHPRDMFDNETIKPLDDWLYNYYMRLAVKYSLPVQIHTGHVCGIRNEISKANAVNLISLFELHQDVQFDLLHCNWPYVDEYLFIGKNYPNVSLNLCWTNSIDPIYSIEFLKRAIMTVPHTKIAAFGGDTYDIEVVVGYLIQARDHVACALSELVDDGWMTMDDAKEVAADWFFNNPNRLYQLGHEEYRAEK